MIMEKGVLWDLEKKYSRKMKKECFWSAEVTVGTYSEEEERYG